jgi:hypothetical protein
MKRKKGAALIEFALIAMTLYLLLAGGIELGRMIFVSQTLQDAARLAARELAVTPLPADDKFEDALNDGASVQPNIWNESMLVLDISNCLRTDDLQANIDVLPLPPVNRALRPLLISESADLGDGNGPRRLLRYPGELFRVTGGTQSAYPNSCVVVRADLIPLIPRVVQRNDVGGSKGVETIAWVRVLSEVRADSMDPQSGPFSFSATSTSPQKGLAAVAIRYPFQSTLLSAFRKTPATATDPLPPNVSNAITADDESVTVQGLVPPDMPAMTLVTPGSCPEGDPCLAYSGKYGLGQQYALSTFTPNGKVRPYRNLLLGQAIYRREVVQ